MLPISSSSSSIYSLISKFFCSISSSSSIISKVCLLFSPFYLFQFHSNLPQYSLSYLLSNHPNNFFAINLPSSSSLLNILSSLSCLFISSISRQYSLRSSVLCWSVPLLPEHAPQGILVEGGLCSRCPRLCFRDQLSLIVCPVCLWYIERDKRDIDCDKQIEKAVTAPNCVLKGL